MGFKTKTNHFLVVAFYEKCGFAKKENEMAKYAPESRVSTPRL